MKTESVRIDKKILNALRKYCASKGIKLTWFVSKAIEEKLNREK